MSLVNFRDLGGMETTGGKEVAPSRLLRTGEITQPSDQDLRELSAHDPKVVVDFRSKHEVDKAPFYPVAGATYMNCDVMAGSEDNFADPKAWLRILDPSRVDETMKGLYANFITSDAGRAGYTQFVKACVANETGAVLFNCAAGKDRTGIAAAIILKLLGVSDAAIFEDYLKTNELRKEVNQEILEGYRQKGLNEDQLKALEMLYGVKTAYLQAAFDAMASTYGGFEGYITQGLGIEPQDIETLKARYLI